MNQPLVYRLQTETLDWSFTPRGGPIDDDSPEVKEVFEKMGRAHAAWARMEFLFDAILIHVNKESESPETYNPRHAFGFKNKVELLKDWLDQPKLAPGKESSRKFLSMLKEFAGDRNEIFHGHLKSYDKATKTLLFQTCVFQGNDTFSLKETTRDLEALDVFLELANGATMALTEFAAVLFRRVD